MKAQIFVVGINTANVSDATRWYLLRVRYIPELVILGGNLRGLS
jgi:hypothetical protein